MTSPEAISALFATIGSYFTAGSAATAGTTAATAGTTAATTTLGTTAVSSAPALLASGTTAAAAGTTPAAVGAGLTAATALNYASTAFSVLQGLGALASGNQSAANAVAEAEQRQVQGRADRNRQRRINAYQEGLFRAEAGTQGTVFSGSPFLAYLENVKEGELMAQDRAYAANIGAIGLRQQAKQYRNTGQFGLASGIAKGAYSLGSSLLS